MNAASTTHSAPRRASTILGLLFLGLLWTPTLGALLGLDRTTALLEKRSLAQVPKLAPGLGGLKQFITGLEASFNDHFGFRTRLILWHRQWSAALFGGGFTSVMAGKEGWLFLKSDHMIDHYRGVQQFTPQELRDWRILLEQRRDWLAQRGIKYLFVVAPDKHTIYPEYLPGWMKKVRPHTKLDQFISYMRERSSVEILDLRPALLGAKQRAPTYFKTDSHWNLFGAFVASQEIAKALAKQLPEIVPVSSDIFALKCATGNGGDLAAMLGLEMVDDQTVYLRLKAPVQLSSTCPLPKGKEGIGNETDRPYSRTGALVFHDSFGISLRLFLSDYFAEANYLWQYPLDPVRIEREKPLVVISEMVERHFNEQLEKIKQAEVLK
jgi:hypothetical protein